MLVVAGANLKATTRLGGYTPLYLAAQQGHAVAIEGQDRPANVRGERAAERARLQGDDLAQPTMSSSSRPLVSLTMARTKKKEMAANRA